LQVNKVFVYSYTFKSYINKNFIRILVFTNHISMKYVFNLAFLLFSVSLSAQMVPDFDVTDSEGQRIQLYADHLNQGQSVVLKIFFTSCPPCNRVAPDIQDLYVEWGEGQNDVEFIELSDKSFDTDARVNFYKNQHDITFPGVGEEGGSLAAVDPYTRAPLGPYFGTPTFIVIAPDGTHEFDVGAGNGLTLTEALDAAIARTGAVKPGGPVRPDFVFEGGLNSTRNPGVADVTVQFDVRPIEGAPDSLNAHTFQITSDLNGVLRLPIDSLEAYEWYEGLVTNNGSFTFGDNVENGLSTIDLINIQRHILTISLFEEDYQEIAADADFNGQVNVLDLFEIQRAILGLPDIWSLSMDAPVTQPCGPDYFKLTDRIDGLCTGDFVLTKIGDVTPD